MTGHGRRDGVPAVRGRPVTRRLRALTGVAERTSAGDAGLPLVLDLVDALTRTGLSVPHALAGAGAAVGGPRGAVLGAVAGALVLGTPWDEAWAPAAADDLATTALERALRPAWDGGVAPSAALVATADALRRDRDGRAAAAAGRLAVRLVLPLGLCHLPAFVLIGIVPVLVATAGTGL